VTSMRTGGNVGGYADLNLAAAIKAGNQVGPSIDATAPYVNGPSPFTQMYVLKDSADARRFVAFWADAGATSLKAYMNITRAELAAAVDEAHRRGLKITGHLCSITTGKPPISASTTWSTASLSPPTSSRTSSRTSVPDRTRG